MNLIELDEVVLVAGQIQAGGMADLAAKGVTLIVNNRPDGEESGQPSASLLESAARAAGLDYLHIPVVQTFDSEQVAALADALDHVEGRVLAFCKSGTRSTYLWALARARQGADVDTIVQRASVAGYDIRPLLPWLKQAEGEQG
jgi:uncharacterized protein (TIGR01244 family)